MVSVSVVRGRTAAKPVCVALLLLFSSCHWMYAFHMIIVFQSITEQTLATIMLSLSIHIWRSFDKDSREMHVMLIIRIQGLQSKQQVIQSIFSFGMFRCQPGRSVSDINFACCVYRMWIDMCYSVIFMPPQMSSSSWCKRIFMSHLLI